MILRSRGGASTSRRPVSGPQRGVFADGAQILQHQPLLDASSMKAVPTVQPPKIVSINIFLLSIQSRMNVSVSVYGFPKNSSICEPNKQGDVQGLLIH
jgi:hypothetical protein